MDGETQILHTEVKNRNIVFCQHQLPYMVRAVSLSLYYSVCSTAVHCFCHSVMSRAEQIRSKYPTGDMISGKDLA